MVQVRVGQIGLGNMGGSVARHLLDEEFDVVGYDVDAETVDSFESYGGEAAGSNAAVAADVDVLLTALNYPEVVNEVYLGDDGVVDGAHEGLICIEQSTVPPASTQRLAQDLHSLDIDLLDAPFLSGGPRFARNGTMVLPVGGERAVYEDERVRVVLNAMARETHYMGEVGTGKATKLVSNCMALGNVLLALESMSMGVANGLAPEKLFDTLKFSASSSVMFRVVLPKALNQDFGPTFPVKSTQKDLRYALRAAEEVDFPMHITSTILQLYTAAAAKGYRDEASASVVKVFEEWIGETLAVDDPIEMSADDPVYSA